MLALIVNLPVVKIKKKINWWSPMTATTNKRCRRCKKNAINSIYPTSASWFLSIDCWMYRWSVCKRTQYQHKKWPNRRAISFGRLSWWWAWLLQSQVFRLDQLEPAIKKNIFPHYSTQAKHFNEFFYFFHFYSISNVTNGYWEAPIFLWHLI